MGLTKIQIDQMNANRVLLVVILENIPQLVVQMMFFVQLESDQGFLVLMLFSLTFSVFSTIATIVYHFIKKRQVVDVCENAEWYQMVFETNDLRVFKHSTKIFQKWIGGLRDFASHKDSVFVVGIQTQNNHVEVAFYVTEPQVVEDPDGLAMIVSQSPVDDMDHLDSREEIFQRLPTHERSNSLWKRLQRDINISEKDIESMKRILDDDVKFDEVVIVSVPQDIDEKSPPTCWDNMLNRMPSLAICFPCCYKNDTDDEQNDDDDDERDGSIIIHNEKSIPFVIHTELSPMSTDTMGSPGEGSPVTTMPSFPIEHDQIEEKMYVGFAGFVIFCLLLLLAEHVVSRAR